MGGGAKGGGAKFLGDPAEGRIAKMYLGMVRKGGESGCAKRGWAENAEQRGFPGV